MGLFTRFSKPLSLLLLTVVTLQPVAASEWLDAAARENVVIKTEWQGAAQDCGQAFDAATDLGLDGVRREGGRGEPWQPRGPASPVSARVFYLAGLAGLGFSAYYAFRNVRKMDSFETAGPVAGLTTISFASLYISLRIELNSSSDSSE